MTPAHFQALQAIYAAALDPSLWQGALDAVSAVHGVVGTQLLHADASQEQLNRSVASGYDSAAGESWDRYYSRINVWAPGMLSMPVGIPWLGERICSFDTLRRTEFYNDWVRPHGDIAGGGAIVLDRSPGKLTILGGNFPRKYRERLDPAWQFDLALFGPAIRHALTVNGMMLGLRLERMLAREGIATDGMAVLLVDRQGRLVFADEAGARMGEAGDIVRFRPNARLGFSDETLAAAVERLRHDETAVAPVVRRLPGRAEMVTVIPLTDRGIAALNLPPHPPGRSPRLAVLVSRQSAPPGSALSARLGLSEAETEVALHLARGLSPPEIAEARGASLNTVRNQMKSIFAKTGCRRQSEVVALVLRLSAG